MLMDLHLIARMRILLLLLRAFLLLLKLIINGIRPMHYYGFLRHIARLSVHQEVLVLARHRVFRGVLLGALAKVHPIVPAPAPQPV